MKIIRFVCLSLLLLLTGSLMGCSVFTKTPPDEAVKLAIAQQLAHTQQAIAQDLGSLSDASALSSLKPNFKIEKINVQNRTKVPESEQFLRSKSDRVFYNEAYSVKGTFEASLDNRYQAVEGPFELYLGTNTVDESDVQTWYLIEP